MDSRSKTRARTSGESGQAAVEYILILAIIVIIALSVVWQFSTAFRSYSDKLFDGYIACLLETGELPGSTLCSSETSDFNINDGTQLIAGDIGGGGGGSTGSGRGDNQSRDGRSSSKKDSEGGGNSKDGDSSDSASGGSSDSSGGEALAGGGASAGAGSSPVGRSGKFGRGRQASTAVGNLKTGSDASALTGAPPQPDVVPVGSAATIVDGSRRRALSREYGYSEFQEEEEATDRPAVAPIAKNSQSGNELRPRVTKELMRKPAETAKSSDGRGFTFGNFLKFILIAIIVVAIFVFFGGQLLQISKSGEK